MVRKDTLHCLGLTVGLEYAAGLQEELVKAEPAVPRVAAEGRVSRAAAGQSEQAPPASALLACALLLQQLHQDQVPSNNGMALALPIQGALLLRVA